jgi:hypothetical protein
MSFMSLSLIFFSAPVTAQSIYRWTDAQGRVHFSNAPISEATAVDDELPPATSFGGAQDSSPSPLQTPPFAEQQPDAQRSTAVPSPNERETEESEKDVEPTNSEEASTPDQEPASTTEETAGAESEEPEGEDSDIESLPQASVDFSEREEPETQTVASENQRPSLLDEDEDQPAPETKDFEEEDSDESEDSDDTENDDENEDEPEEDEEDS